MIRRETYFTEMSARRIAESVLGKMNEGMVTVHDTEDYIKNVVNYDRYYFTKIIEPVFTKRFGQLAFKIMCDFLPWNSNDKLAYYLYHYISDNNLFDGLDVVNNVAKDRKKAKSIIESLLDDEDARDEFVNYIISFIDE